MDKLTKIVHHSIFSTSRQPIWWLLAFIQAAAFSVIGQLAQPRLLISPLFLLLVLAALVLSPLTVWLWQDMAAEKERKLEAKAKADFKRPSLEGGFLVIFTAALVVLARIVFPFWPIHTLIFAIVGSTGGLALLYVALCGQDWRGALRLAGETWNKKLSFSAAAALVLILAHGISFTLAHGVLLDFYSFQEFSVSGHSATIWLLLSGLVLLIGFFSAILNCFVVFLFLDMIARKKDPEAEKAKVGQPIRVGAV